MDTAYVVVSGMELLEELDDVVVVVLARLLV